MADATVATATVDTTNRVNGVLLPIFAALAIVGTFLPLRSFYHNRNVAACNLVVALNLLNLIVVVNAIIWPTSDWTTWWNGHGLCDLEVYVRIPLTTALVASLACLTKTLTDAIDINKHKFQTSEAKVRRRIALDFLFCWGAAILQVSLYYLVQPGRYAILPVYGCGTLIDNSWLTIVIILVPPPLFSLISSYHACVIMYRLHKHRNLSTALTTTSSGFTSRRYVKLFIWAASLITFQLGIEFYFLYLNLEPVYVPYSFSRVHDPISSHAILYLSTSDVPRSQWIGWASVAVDFLVFVFFGFGDESIESYRYGLRFFGFGKIWPSLYLSREDLKAKKKEEQGSTSNQSVSRWSSKFDIITKTMNYFDTKSTKSQVASLGETTLADEASPDKDSKGQLSEQITTFGSGSLLDKNASRVRHEDVIEFAPSPPGMTPNTFPAQKPETALTNSHTPKNRGIFSVFRTSLQLPQVFRSSKPPTNSVDAEKGVDLEAQNQFKTNISLASSTISTNIWCGPKSSNSNQHAKTLSADSTQSQYGESLDPLSPKLGSRAYRERERREIEQDRRERKAEQSRSLASSLQVETDREALDTDRVKVEKSVERTEEQS